MKSWLLFLYTLVCSFTFAQGLSGHYYGTINPFINEMYKFVSVSDYRFEGNRYVFSTATKSTKAEAEIPLKYRQDGYYEELGSYKIVSIGVLKKIVFQSDNDFTYKKELGILMNARRLYLFEGDRLFFQPDEDLRWEGTMPRVIKAEASSYLSESQRKYDGTGFIPLRHEKLLPWVENAAEYGLGEWLDLTIEVVRFPVTSFIISNGYVSFEKPELYSLNARIKKLRIIAEQTPLDITVELRDSPDLQQIMLPSGISGEKVKFRFIIVEVYPGTNWKDTCITMIAPLGELPR